MQKSSVVLSLLAVLAIPLPASAHTVLVNPPPLIGNDDAKEGPCGCTFGGGLIECPADYEVTEVEAGSQLTVSWNETINHEGDFRIAYAPVAPEAAVVADFDDAVAQVTLPDDMDTGLFTATFTVPNTPCELCTLQVRQFMANAPDPYYFTCAAVRIVASGEGGGASGPASSSSAASGSGSASASASSGGVGDDGGQGGEAQYQPVPADEGCSTSGSTAGGFGALALVALACSAIGNRRGSSRRVRADG